MTNRVGNLMSPQFQNNFNNRSKLTDFQWKVLKAAAKIPVGETRTYKWVAQEVGSPRAVRAVGQALKRNPYPVVIPCHRVIREDGTLGGYAGGSSKKKAELLAMERELKERFKN